MLYVVTGVHGAHVLLGMLLLLLYTLQAHTWPAYGGHSIDATHGVLGIVLYWHFVDAVWICVVLCVYWAQLAMPMIQTEHSPAAP